MSELTGSNHRCRAQFKCAQTVIGHRFAGNSPNVVPYYYYYNNWLDVMFQPSIIRVRAQQGEALV